jgi:hypothetical protein
MDYVGYVHGNTERPKRTILKQTIDEMYTMEIRLKRKIYVYGPENT